MTDVYLSLNGEVIPNHGYVEISDIGSSDTTALLCHTNRPASGGTNSGGDWFTPDGIRVGDPGSTDVPGFERNRGPMVVRLRRSVSSPDEGYIGVKLMMLQKHIDKCMLDCTTLEVVCTASFDHII